MGFWSKIFGGDKTSATVNEPLTFFKYLSNNTQKLSIEARGDRVGGSITYQWKDHGPFTVEKGVADESTTVVSMSPDLVNDFASIVKSYKDYLAPWRKTGSKIPKIVVNKMLQDLNA